MLTIRPIPRALVPVDSNAARRVSALNYDEFQGDAEIWEAIRSAPDSVLGVTMAHCAVDSPAAILPGDSEASLELAHRNFQRLSASPLTREAKRILYLYEIVDARRPGVRQIGLGGLAPTAEIRTEDTPDGPIIRNEGVRPPKARGRARLIEATGAIIGTVNNAVPDDSGAFAAALERHADGTAPDFEGGGGRAARRTASGSSRNRGAIARLQRLLAAEPEAYVADGNHRSAAAAMLGHESFLTVFFPADRMAISPYNRLVRLPRERDATAVDAALGRSFEAVACRGRALPARRHPCRRRLCGGARLAAGDAAERCVRRDGRRGLHRPRHRAADALRRSRHRRRGGRPAHLRGRQPGRGMALGRGRRGPARTSPSRYPP